VEKGRKHMEILVASISISKMAKIPSMFSIKTRKTMFTLVPAHQMTILAIKTQKIVRDRQQGLSLLVRSPMS
jgi:hypothetical protein